VTEREDLRERWMRLLDRARGELIQMYTYRSMYREVGRIIDENDALPPSEFFNLIGTAYSYMQALAVRRQVDSGKDAASLGRVLHEIQEHPGEATAAGLDIARVTEDAARIRSETTAGRAGAPISAR
jgi:hypothetical protein